MNSGNGQPIDSFDLARGDSLLHRPHEAHPASASPSIMAILLHQWPTALLVGIVLAAASVMGIWYFVNPKYKVVATLHVSPVARPILSDKSPENFGDYRQYVGTQALTITGPAIIDKMLAKTDIKSLPSLANLPNPIGYVKKRLEAGQIPS